LRFNGLPSIEAADAEMRTQNKLNTAFSVLGPIFVKHDMCRTWGISLLHKHWSVQDEELPITVVSKVDAPREYELRPRMNFSKAFYPAILAVGEGSESLLEPLEYSGDEAAQLAVEELCAKPEFVREFCNALTTNNLASAFGLGVPRAVTNGFELVEFTYEERTSVSKELPSAQVAEMKVIETAWMFGKGAAGTCEKSCFAKCNVPGHTGTHTPVHKPPSE